MWNVDVDVCIHNCDEYGLIKNLDLNLQSMINNNQFQMSANNFSYFDVELQFSRRKEIYRRAVRHWGVFNFNSFQKKTKIAFPFVVKILKYTLH